MKKNLILLLALAITTMFIGCEDIRTVKKVELEKAKSEWKEPKVSIWYYVGTKDGYHHFLHQDLNEQIVYRISEQQFPLKDTFQKTNDRNKWRVMPWGVHSTQQ